MGRHFTLYRERGHENHAVITMIALAFMQMLTERAADPSVRQALAA